MTIHQCEVAAMSIHHCEVAAVPHRSVAVTTGTGARVSEATTIATRIPITNTTATVTTGRQAVPTEAFPDTDTGEMITAAVEMVTAGTTGDRAHSFFVLVHSILDAEGFINRTL